MEKNTSVHHLTKNVSISTLCNYSNICNMVICLTMNAQIQDGHSLKIHPYQG